MDLCAENKKGLKANRLCVAVALAALALAGNANAAAVVCPGAGEIVASELGRQHELVAADSYGVSCYDAGGEDALDSGATFGLPSDYTLLDIGGQKNSDEPNVTPTLMFSDSSFRGVQELAFTIDGSVWDAWNEVSLVFTTWTGNAQPGGDLIDPDWVEFRLFAPAATDLGAVLTWSLLEGTVTDETTVVDLNLDRNLRRVELFGVTPVPLPAAAPLFAGALGIVGLLGWRRQRRTIPLAAQRA